MAGFYKQPKYALKNKKPEDGFSDAGRKAVFSGPHLRLGNKNPASAGNFTEFLLRAAAADSASHPPQPRPEPARQEECIIGLRRASAGGSGFIRLAA
ncbi:hypothetical protein BEN74_10625 [Acinetobacter sp. WCHAc010034]|nr:hypothetical protein BEN74_10625 [Acinetobacter sp. WCHAc010034]